MRRRATMVLAMVGVAMALGSRERVRRGPRRRSRSTPGAPRASSGRSSSRFAEENDIAIDVRYGDTNDLALLIDTEGDRSPADVYWGQSPGATAYLAGKDLLAPLPQNLLDLVEPGFEDGAGPLGRRQRPPARARLQRGPRARGRPAGLGARPHRPGVPRAKVGVAPTNGSFQDFITAMRQLEGEDVAREWLRGHGGERLADVREQQRDRRGRRPRRDPDGPRQPLLQLPVPLGGSGAAEPQPLLRGRATSAPSCIPSSASILASSDKKEDAERFIAFLLSEESQLYFAEETFEYPLADDVPAAEGVPPLSSLRPPPGEQADQLGDIETTGKMIAESGLN